MLRLALWRHRISPDLLHPLEVLVLVILQLLWFSVDKAHRMGNVFEVSGGLSVGENAIAPFATRTRCVDRGVSGRGAVHLLASAKTTTLRATDHPI